MRLGLIGTGKQGQRYLQERNGGRHIVVSGSRSIPLDDVDGVIIATHPAAHKALALEAIAAGKHVLIEKPLALSLSDCEEIINAAERADVGFDVAHTHLWSLGWKYGGALFEPVAIIRYLDHERDFSAWLDWAPHGIALIASAVPNASAVALRASVVLSKESGLHGPSVQVFATTWSYVPDSLLNERCPPMARMLRDFVAYKPKRYDFNRRVYRALFAQENHGTT